MPPRTGLRDESDKSSGVDFTNDFQAQVSPDSPSIGLILSWSNFRVDSVQLELVHKALSRNQYQVAIQAVQHQNGHSEPLPNTTTGSSSASAACILQGSISRPWRQFELLNLGQPQSTKDMGRFLFQFRCHCCRFHFDQEA